ncbi:alpha-(1-_3)-arabinofuranosyltransferase [Actinocorallia sp. API 0066]|uniref:alpha-(1->3)-arabinofuranosyltransferase domain-containing protein n=1 Tax=Actinocorallia sp. API 0066 TaxID=2896846 RepID=UPI001E4321E2|nr:alpha-(1->3)-arabinofuranosyltransferase family protein [Actinocorallia sp. API 0066]MCD0451253.1 alpha-(1->3)-arabinofuranosyltransferase [Actinocorallia sp. API 0066]
MGALVLLTLAFAAAPGRILPDTKLDMALNPDGFLARALHLWDPSGAFGQVQNQAYGYFFPMGPFYLLGDALGTPPWITQRLWLALVLCTAYFGVLRLARAMDLGGPNARLVAAFAYALAPRAQTLLGVNSSEFWPTAVLPWTLLPLVTVRSPRKAAALSALGVVVCGGINATAVFAVLLVPGLYLLFYRRRLLLWWVPLTAAASFWWLAPTFLMGRYVFPFLPYTETATTTTSVTSLPNILRGAAQWPGYLPSGFSPWWPAGNMFAASWWLVLATGLLAGFGLLGIHRSRHRVFLGVSLLLGLAVIVSGHPGGPLADQVRDLLDGPLAPLRNLHKFDALVRLPLALGLAQVAVKIRTHRVAAVLVALTAVPAVTPGLGIREAPVGVPSYMREAAGWLNAREGTVLAVPGQGFGQYTYGRMMDDPLQSLLTGRWAGRIVTPSGSVGLARLLQTFDDRFATGRGSPGMAEVLARMGVRYLFVRNDVERGVLAGAWPSRVHDAIDAMPGVRKVAAFGKDVGLPFSDATASYDQRYRAVEIYEIPAAAPRATVVEAEPLRVTGGPEALIALADQGMLGDGRPVVLNDADGSGAGPDVATDTLRRRELAFSDLRGGVSTTMTADQEYLGDASTKDFTLPGWEAHTSVAEYRGIKDVTASTSAADITTGSNVGLLSQHPFSALDGDPSTQWTSASWSGAIGEWLKVAFTEPRDPGRISAAFSVSDLLGPSVSEVAVETEAGRIVQEVRKTARPQELRVPSGQTRWLKVEITGLRTKRAVTLGTRVGITELRVPGVKAERAITVPDGAGTLLFTGLNGYSPGCTRGSRAWVCSGYLAAHGEEGTGFVRAFTHPGGEVRLTGTAIVSHPGLAAEYTGTDAVRASSALVDHPAAQARSAFDGDPSTTWTPDVGDDDPSLTRTFAEPVTVSSLRFTFPARRGVTRVTVTGDRGGPQETFISPKGVVRIAAIRTRTLTVEFPGTPGIQISDVSIPGVPPLGVAKSVPSGCGTGPVFTAGGRRLQTRLVGGSVEDVLAGRPVPFASCGKASLPSGGQTLEAEPGSFLVATAAVRPVREAPAKADVAAASVTRWDASERAVEVRTTSGGYLTVPENFNPGWKAVLDGRTLTPVTLDGWRQAWKLPADASGTVHLTYTPDRPYRLALLTGALMALAIALLAALPSRRAPTLLPTHPKDRDLSWTAPLLGLWAAGPLGLGCGLLTWGLLQRRRPPARLILALTALASTSTLLATYLFSKGLPLLHPLLSNHLPTALCVVLITLTLRPPSRPLRQPKAQRRQDQRDQGGAPDAALRLDDQAAPEEQSVGHDTRTAR